MTARQKRRASALYTATQQAAAVISTGTREDLGWQADARCAEVGGDEWFPEKGSSTRAAKKVCMACEVREDCLLYALQHDMRFGVWGGLSERERRTLKPQAVAA